MMDAAYLDTLRERMRADVASTVYRHIDTDAPPEVLIEALVADGMHAVEQVVARVMDD